MSGESLSKIAVAMPLKTLRMAFCLDFPGRVVGALGSCLIIPYFLYSTWMVCKSKAVSKSVDDDDDDDDDGMGMNGK